MAKTHKKKHRSATKRRGGVLGMILCFILGVIIGVGGLAGGVIGAGSYIFTQPVDKTVNFIEKYVPTDIYGTLFGTKDKEGYLNEKYATMKVTDLLGDSYKAISDLANGGSLSTLNEVSPKIGTLVDNLLKKTDKYAIPLDKETLMTTALNQLPKYVGDSLKEIPVGDLLHSFGQGDEPLLMAICYGEEGVDYTFNEEGDVVMIGNAQKTTVNDLLSNDFASVFDNITLDSILTVTPDDSLMCSLAYGPSNRYTFEGETVQMTQITYTIEDKGDGVLLYDDKDAIVLASAEEMGGNVLKLTFTDGEIQYVSFTPDGVGVAFSDETLTSPALYPKTKISDLTEDSMGLIDNIYLKDALNIGAQEHKILISLAYGEEGVDFKYVGEGDSQTIEMIGDAKPRTIGSLRIGSADIINEIPLSDIVAADEDDALIMYLLYGRKDVHYTVESDGSIKMLQKQIALIGDVVYNEYGEKLSGYTLDTVNSTYTAADGSAYKYVPSSGLTIKTEDGTMAEVYYLTDLEDNAVNFTKTTLGDMMGSDNVLTSLTERITVKEVMDEETISSNVFFKHIQDETIATLPAAINNLTLQQVYEKEIFKTDNDGNFLDKNGNVTTNKDEYAIEHEWWYLLHDEDICASEHGPDRDGQCIQDYKVTEFATLITNMRRNVETATLYQLSEDGMITGMSQDTLDSNIRTGFKKGDGSTINFNPEGLPVDKSKLGEMTVLEMLNYVNVVFEAIDQYEAALDGAL